ncbi:MAG: DUF255 domain-containing protein [Candidatus Pedobacter colombiensis]|uniref:DUF255 domain-containing protein n=1 Tax=Candidatus Pedobacter colombiensis TaxID=3121371 RepID=A0AAJ5WB80_9SPHI|nr:DUF255 domain-containing protein [Pedobacter sp.]WEK20410.1 MAG: DUF255 domain-containing protein [Pedobacter sp.]
MKKSLLTLTLLSLALLTQAQGVKFENNLSWQQIKEKARSENKFIFLDVFTTWCGPCKAMEKDIYPDQKVGEALNKDFICVKVQMDQTPKDEEAVKKWYADAKLIDQKYKITAYPSFLFFSLEGELVHRGLGGKNIADFLAMAKDALRPETQLYRQLEAYKNGKRDYAVLPKLSAFVKDMLADKEMAKTIAKDYKTNYLDHLNESQLLTKENFSFIQVNYELLKSSDLFFKLFTSQPKKVDSMMYPGMSKSFVDWAIIKEELDDKLWKDTVVLTKTPDWNKLVQNISKKYGAELAKKMVTDYKPGFYRRIGNWSEFARSKNQAMKTYPPKPGGGMGTDAWNLNATAWDVFLHCTDKTVLQHALIWSELSLKLDNPLSDTRLDTKANLLYKLGRVQQAIEIEQMVVDMFKGADAGEYSETIKKMKSGLATW